VKTYVGKRTAAGVIVAVQMPSGSIRSLRHIPYHSPSGFEWGYEGSGPADLALAILVDHFNERPPSKGWQAARLFDRWTRNSRTWKLHQPFKREFVATWHAAWTITSQEIETWVELEEVNDD
jgi:hypothetical protein